MTRGPWPARAARCALMISAHTGTGLSVLHEAEREDGREDDQPGKASHVLIIDSVEQEPRCGEDCQDNNDQNDDPWRPAAAVLEDRSLRRRLDLGVGGRSPAAITDERVVSDFSLQFLHFIRDRYCNLYSTS